LNKGNQEMKILLFFSEHLANLNAEHHGKNFESELLFFDEFAAYAVKDSDGRYLMHGGIFSKEYETPNEKEVR